MNSTTTPLTVQQHPDRGGTNDQYHDVQHAYVQWRSERGMSS